MNTEQIRAEFDKVKQDLWWQIEHEDYAFEIFKAGYRAALQSRERGYAVERLIGVVRYYMSFGCPVCSGDCFSANPPVSACPVREAQEAIDHARRIEGDGK